MLTTNKQSQDLHQIAGVQDISHENAAAISGGTATLADGFNLGPARFQLSLRPLEGRGSLGGFNNRASSIKISRNQVWLFRTGRNFGGPALILRGGPEGTLYNLTGSRSKFNNNIESARRLADSA